MVKIWYRMDARRLIGPPVYDASIKSIKRGATVRLSVWSTMIRTAVALLAAAIVSSVDPGPIHLVPSAHAASFTVNSQTDAVDANPGDGFCATTSLPSEGVRCTLRAAIQEANAQSGADTIQLPAGAFMLTIAGPDEDAALTGDLDVLGDLTLTGAGAASTVIDANQLDRSLDISSGVAVEVRGLTIRNGRALYGGGIRSLGYQLALLDSVVSHNVARIAGGGILTEGGTSNVVLTRSVITDNVATGGPPGAVGGGIRGDTVSLIDSTAADNVVGSESGSGQGGGIHGGQVTLTNSTVSGNRSIGSNGNQGGGISAGSLMATNSVISRNTATSGLGGGAFSVSMTLVNTTISGNSPLCL
jgi:CSLREA domain-containing protein